MLSVIFRKISTTLYPNPLVGAKILTLVTSGGEITLSNQLGSILFTQNLPEGKNELDLSQLTQGLYWVQITTPVKREVIPLQIY